MPDYYDDNELDRSKLGGTFSVVDSDGGKAPGARSIGDAGGVPGIVQEFRARNLARRQAQGLPQRTSAFSRRTALQNAGQSGYKDNDATIAARQEALREQYAGEDDAYSQGLRGIQEREAGQLTAPVDARSEIAAIREKGAQAQALQGVRGEQVQRLQELKGRQAGQLAGQEAGQRQSLQQQRLDSAKTLQQAGFENQRDILELSEAATTEQGRREMALPLLQEFTGDARRAAIVAASLPEEVFAADGPAFMSALYQESLKGEQAKLEPEGIGQNVRAFFLGPQDAPDRASRTLADEAKEPSFLRRSARSIFGGLTGVGQPGERLATDPQTGQEVIFPGKTRSQQLYDRLYGEEE